MADKTFLAEGDAAAAAVAKAPRVSLADIEASIAFEQSMLASDVLSALNATAPLGAAPDFPGIDVLAPLEVLTMHVMILKNGWTVLGKSAPASRENFDRALGAKLARDDAIRQLWPLFGFNLRQRLHEGSFVASAGVGGRIAALAHPTPLSTEPTGVLGRVLDDPVSFLSLDFIERDFDDLIACRVVRMRSGPVVLGLHDLIDGAGLIEGDQFTIRKADVLLRGSHMIAAEAHLKGVADAKRNLRKPDGGSA